MSITTSSNPTLSEKTFRGLSAPVGDPMTINGVVGKAAILFGLVAITFMVAWNMVSEGSSDVAAPLAMGAGVIGMVMSIILSFKPTLAPVLAPAFALVEGFFLGAISAWYEYGAVAGGYEGIVLQAAFATLGTFGTMLFVYRAGIIKVTDRFRAVVTTAMFSIFVVYALAFLLSFAGISLPFINDATPLGIGISVFVIVVASLMLLVDFDMIERGAAGGAPKYMEWYGAFALLVTLVWIYIEFLRLLSKINRR